MAAAYCAMVLHPAAKKSKSWGLSLADDSIFPSGTSYMLPDFDSSMRTLAAGWKARKTVRIDGPPLCFCWRSHPWPCMSSSLPELCLKENMDQSTDSQNGKRRLLGRRRLSRFLSRVSSGLTHRSLKDHCLFFRWLLICGLGFRLFGWFDRVSSQPEIYIDRAAASSSTGSFWSAFLDFFVLAWTERQQSELEI